MSKPTYRALHRALEAFDEESTSERAERVLESVRNHFRALLSYWRSLGVAAEIHEEADGTQRVYVPDWAEYLESLSHSQTSVTVDGIGIETLSLLKWIAANHDLAATAIFSAGGLPALIQFAVETRAFDPEVPNSHTHPEHDRAACRVCTDAKETA